MQRAGPALAFLLGLFFLGGFTGCAVGPDYRRPPVADLVPPDWHWRKAHPSDAVPKGPWWEVFGDPTLSALEVQAEKGNQDLQAAVARVTEARAAARISAADFFPQVDAEPSVLRFRTSPNDPNFPFPFPSRTATSFSTPLDLSYEIDLWGRVRRSFEAARDQAQASAADYRNVLLTLQADVALNYFVLRGLDSEIAVVRRNLQSRQDALDYQQLRFKSGLGREIDYEQARSEFALAKADLADDLRQREETSHQLALLCGQAASFFNLPAQALSLSAPVIPAGLPATLLERRPDIAEAERQLAAKNAQIGVAYAAFFPSLSLTGQGGYLSADASSLFNWSNRVWSIGPSVTLPLLEGGRNLAQLKQARATYQEYTARYRETILIAFKDVEDALSDIERRGEQLSAEREAVASAQQATALARERYEKGSASYLEVVDAERTQLSAESTESIVHGQQLVATVQLIKSLGGSWGQVPSTVESPGVP